jgi:elongation factor Ts
MDIEKIKKLRQETGISLKDCKKALDEAKGDIEKAKEILKNWQTEILKEKEKRTIKAGIIESYVHPNKKIGVLLEIGCESDFVSRSEGFQKLAHELCLQIAALDPLDIDELLAQPWIKDEKKTIKDLIKENIAQFKENIEIKRFIRYKIDADIAQR